MKTLFLSVASMLVAVVAFSGFSAPLAHANTVNPLAPTCVTHNVNMRVGATDVSTSGAVAKLQGFLAYQGNFDLSLLGSGRFGPMTYRAVVAFQKAHNLPMTGYVGPMTRAVINGITCPGGTATAVSLYSVNPSSATVSQTVSVTGFGFTNANTILMDGSVVARDVPITSSRAIACTTDPACHGGINQTIEFTVPSALSPNCPSGMYCAMYMRQVTPGTYAVTVMNDNGTSNTLMLTVVSSDSNQTLSVTGLDAPATLTLGQTGTWTVRTSAPSNAGNLHYSVLWGDESTALSSSIMAPAPQNLSSSATFTHAYSRSGTYTQVFTVTDDMGHSVRTSASIVISPLY